MCRQRWHTVCIVQIVSVLYCAVTFFVSVDLHGLCQKTIPKYIKRHDRVIDPLHPGERGEFMFRTSWFCPSWQRIPDFWEDEILYFLEPRLPHGVAKCFFLNGAPVPLKSMVEMPKIRDGGLSKYGDVGYNDVEGNWYLNEVSFRCANQVTLHWDNLMEYSGWNITETLIQKVGDMRDDSCESTFCLAQKESGRMNGPWVYATSVVLVPGSFLVGAGYRAYHWKMQGRAFIASSFFLCSSLSCLSMMTCAFIQVDKGRYILRFLCLPTVATAQLLHSLFGDNVRESIAYGELIAVIGWSMNFSLLAALLFWSCTGRVYWQWICLATSMFYSVPFAFILEGSLQDAMAESMIKGEGIEVAHLNAS